MIHRICNKNVQCTIVGPRVEKLSALTTIYLKLGKPRGVPCFLAHLSDWSRDDPSGLVVERRHLSSGDP